MSQRPDPMLPQVCEVRRVHRETDQTFTWELSAPPGTPSFAFQPGQFNMLYQYGVGEVPISISGDAAKGDVIVHTIRAVGGVTAAMQQLDVGAQIGLRGPFGSAWPVAAARGKDVILMAGGIGLAPLRPAIYALLQARADIGRLLILYGVRQPTDILFADELDAWRDRGDVECIATVDMGDAGWRGQVGLVTELLGYVAFDPDNTLAMLCGPEVMMRFSAQALCEKGVSPEAIYVSMERNMKCAVGWCGHCQLGPHFVCKDGPVYPYPTMRRWLERREA